MSASERVIGNAIQALYTAVGDTSEWPAALAGLAAAFDCPKVGLYRYEGAGVVDLQAYNHDEEAQRLYLSHYWALDPAARLIPESRAGQWIGNNVRELVDPDTEYMIDYAIPHGIRWVNGVKLHEDAGSMSVFGVQRPADAKPFGPEALEAFNLLGPHITRAWSLKAELRRAELMKGLSLAALELLDQPVYAVTLEGRLLLANSTAEEQLVQGAPFQVTAGKLKSRDADVDRQLRHALADCAHERGSAFAVRLPGALWAARVVPLPSRGGVSLIYLTRLGGPSASCDLLKQVLNFSHSEAAIAHMLADGRSVKEIAYERQVSANTVRTQVRSILAKAGVRRQIDLTRLLATIPSAMPPTSNRRTQ
jgi:DNA-binding CsgD family transcriptional regulator